MNLQELASHAARHWQGQLGDLLSHRENAVFDLRLPSGRAALRLHRPGYQTETTIRSELWWCAQLAQSGVAVPPPVPAEDGRVLVQLPDGTMASAVAWVDGVAIGQTGKPFDVPVSQQLQQHRALGRLLAQMHDATDRLTLPEDFFRPRWDVTGLVGDAPLWGPFWLHPGATSEQKRVLLRTRDHLRDWLSSYDGDFGLIHADVLRENVFTNGGSLTLIDFDDSGFGYRLYDLGTAMLGNLREPAYPDLLAALTEGYSEVRRVEAQSVEMFTLARACASVGWTMPRLPSASSVHRSHIERCTTLAARLIP